MGIPIRIHILKFVAEQGIVTADDIHYKFDYSSKSDAPRVTMNQLGLAKVKFGNIKYGVRYIDNVELINLVSSYYPELSVLNVYPLQLHHIQHNLGVNRIRILLEKSPQANVCEWISENMLKSSLYLTKENLQLSKIPDAIFWRKTKSGDKQKFFLEYERSLKSKKRYMEIFKFYASRTDTQNRNVIYICEDDYIQGELMRMEQDFADQLVIDGAGLYFQFLTYEKFCETYFLNQRPKENVSCLNSTE